MPADPSTEYWQAKVSEAVGKIATEFGTSGVYMDQIASMCKAKAAAVASSPAAVKKLLSTDAEACYDAESGKAGGGAAWADGYRTALAKAVEAAGPGKVVISESNAEAYLGSMHAFLAI